MAESKLDYDDIENRIKSGREWLNKMRPYIETIQATITIMGDEHQDEKLKFASLLHSARSMLLDYHEEWVAYSKEQELEVLTLNMLKRNLEISQVMLEKLAVTLDKAEVNLFFAQAPRSKQ